jgi:hypothetical protein
MSLTRLHRHAAAPRETVRGRAETEAAASDPCGIHRDCKTGLKRLDELIVLGDPVTA